MSERKDYSISRLVDGKSFTVDVKTSPFYAAGIEFSLMDTVTITHGNGKCVLDGKTVDILLKALRKSGDYRIKK